MTFLDIAACSLVEGDRRFRGVYCLQQQGDDEGSTKLWNVGLLQQDYIALYPWKLSSSYSPRWEPEIPHKINSMVLALTVFQVSLYS
jgi:hypothetical protein